VKHRAYLEMEDSGELYEALRVEAGREIPRTEVKIEWFQGKLKMKIRAEDLHALRAALNSYLRWINLGYEVMEVIEDGRA